MIAELERRIHMLEERVEMLEDLFVLQGGVFEDLLGTLPRGVREEFTKSRARRAVMHVLQSVRNAMQANRPPSAGIQQLIEKCMKLEPK